MLVLGRVVLNVRNAPRNPRELRFFVQSVDDIASFGIVKLECGVWQVCDALDV